jgi:hypothetical protein
MTSNDNKHKYADDREEEEFMVPKKQRSNDDDNGDDNDCDSYSTDDLLLEPEEDMNLPGRLR